MCPACIASTAVIVAGAGSTGGILAVCIGKFRKFFRASSLGSVAENKGDEMNVSSLRARLREGTSGVDRLQAAYSVGGMANP